MIHDEFLKIHMYVEYADLEIFQKGIEDFEVGRGAIPFAVLTF